MPGPLDMTIDFDGDLSGLSRAIVAASDLTPAMKRIADHLEANIRLRFETETDPSGKAWQPSRRVLQDGGQTLSLSGDLKSSISSAYGPDFAEAGPERSFGSAVYAAIHQWGGRIVPKVKKALSFGGRVFAAIVMPARPYVGFTANDPDVFAEILNDHFREKLGGAT